MNDLVRNALMGAAGAAGDKTYIDDIFSTYLYRGSSNSGSGPAQTITNGIDLSGEGGLVWLKSRDATNEHALTDTVTGAGKRLQSESSTSQSTSTESVSGFTNSGFTLPGGWNPMVNASNQNYTSWSFRKKEGFFDIVTWTGNGSTRTIPHNLGSLPGCIMVKNTSSTIDWAVWHRGAVESNATRTLKLNTQGSASSNNTYFDNGSTPPTATNFTVHTSNRVNAVGETYVAYLFAGGESTAATARSVDFDVNDGLTISNSSGDFTFGTGDYTWECWIKWKSNISSSWDVLWQSDNSGSGVNQFFPSIDSNSWNIGNSNAFQIQAPHTFNVGQWYHIAASRASGTLRMFVNGTQVGSVSDSTNYSSTGGTAKLMFSRISSGDICISNLRIIKGTGLYTSSFKPITEPLSNVSGTVLLCCQGSSSTSATVAPSGATLTAVSDPTASTDSPFDDPEGFKFGEGGDQNLIKCGSYVGNGTVDGPEIYLGWEPQWFIIKRTDADDKWPIYDSMRGIVTDNGDSRLYADELNTEYTVGEYFNLTPTGIKIAKVSGEVNGGNGTYAYIAIRRPDGYVGKPAEAGTDAFALDTASGSSSIPTWDSGFPVDFRFHRTPAASGDWYTGSRLTGGDRYVRTNSSNAEANISGASDDSNTGFGTGHDSSFQAWMWKRHAGCDVVAGLKEFNSHNLGKIPEMVWIKRRDNTSDWFVWHKGLNGGTNDGLGYNLRLNSSASENSTPSLCPIGDQLPTATHFKTASDSDIRNAGSIAFLFASVDGISKCGYYDGTGYTGHVITTGFTPRLLIIKNITNANSWFLYDSLRGLGAGNDPYLQMENTNVQAGGDTFAISSTGFTINQTYSSVNQSGSKYIYYAHA